MLLPQLQLFDAVKAMAVRNMSTRALNTKEVDLFQCGRLQAETEWAGIRSEVAKQAFLNVHKGIASDSPYLKQLHNDAKVYMISDELHADVHNLEEGMVSEAPFVVEAAEILRSYDETTKCEEDLDGEILDKEIEVLRLQLQSAKLRNNEIRNVNVRLNNIANPLLATLTVKIFSRQCH
ncbi:hypothetical protein RB195_018668 [Necator americanus]|uniref:Uncharacterized protein n=1 Tax=Necator americanus TaxID=51031 RepID=A0ABR1CAS9_NECAM